RPRRWRQPRLHRGLRLLAGPAVRQGTRRRYGDHRARRTAGPDRPLRGGPLWPLTPRLLRGLTAELMEGTREWDEDYAESGWAPPPRCSAPAPAATGAAVLGLGLAGCGGGGIKSADTAGKSDCGDFRIAVNPWTGYVTNAHIIGYVAKTRLGCNVTYPDVKEEVGWAGMASGSIDTIVENWGHPDLVK